MTNDTTASILLCIHRIEEQLQIMQDLIHDIDKIIDDDPPIRLGPDGSEGYTPKVKKC